MYNNALRFQATDKLDEANEILKKLLEENIPQLEIQGGLPKTMSTLKYSCHINIGNIARQRGNTEEALESFLLVS